MGNAISITQSNTKINYPKTKFVINLSRSKSSINPPPYAACDLGMKERRKEERKAKSCFLF